MMLQRFFEEVEIKFTVNGKVTSDEKMNILIPMQYADKFEGHDFPNMDTLSVALMHANCANEARYYNMWWKVENYERDLMNILKA